MKTKTSLALSLLLALVCGLNSLTFASKSINGPGAREQIKDILRGKGRIIAPADVGTIVSKQAITKANQSLNGFGGPSTYYSQGQLLIIGKGAKARIATVVTTEHGHGGMTGTMGQAIKYIVLRSPNKGAVSGRASIIVNANAPDQITWTRGKNGHGTPEKNLAPTASELFVDTQGDGNIPDQPAPGTR